MGAAPRIENVTVDGTLVSAKNAFGFKVFGALTRAPLQENVFIAPFSVATALAMTCNGAAGETRNAIARTLGVTDISVARLNRAEKTLAGRLKKADERVELLVANSLWARKGIAFNPAFIKINREFYQAEVTALDFNRPDAPGTINAWVKERTRGRIQKIVNQIKPEAVLFLINAVYFKGKWRNEFDPAATREGDFYPGDGATVRVKMMQRSGRFLYCAGDGFQAVELPYGSGKFSMFIFLPAQEVGLDNFLSQFTFDNWGVWLGMFRSSEGTLRLPRFKIEYERSLNDVLTELGMGIAFDLQRADFSAMGRGPFAIGDVKHKSFVEVNEEGTEAAAVTSVEMVLASVPHGRFEMTVDRPFVFAIQDNDTGLILFLGAVVNPAAVN